MNVGRKLDCNFYYRLYFLDLKLERVLRITLRSERFSEGVHNNWSYHCLYFQTPGQLEDFFKLESYLLDISTKSIVLPEKPIYWDILIPNSRSGNKTFVHCSSRYQASHLITIIFAVEILLGDSYFSFKSSAKTYIGNISTINAQSLCTSQSRIRL